MLVFTYIRTFFIYLFANLSFNLGEEISFHPKLLDFKDCIVGIPRLGLVRVDNGLKEDVSLISISGNTVHFHSSFFADKTIGPGGNTTFDIVFLSRGEGLIESSLYIHTSKGLFKYQVKGFGLPNPYRLKPLLGAIPVNGSYEPLITMHNPHDTPIQVVEMFSSGTDFHLKLPEGGPKDAAGEAAAWALEPFQTKPVMKGSFQGKAEGNHTGYIKIRVNSTKITSEYLLVPVEVQVSSAPGIYLRNQDSLDFGLMVRSSDKPKTLSLSLINAQSSSVNIQSVTVKGGNPAVNVEFRPLLIESESTAIVALVTFDPSEVYDLKFSSGVIEIRSECGKFINVPFKADVLQGELEYNATTLGFLAKGEEAPRNFSVRNGFTTPVAIYQVNISHPRLVKVENFNMSNVITPGEQKTIFTFKLKKKSELCETQNEVYLTLKSNITNIKLPIKCYDGKLHLHTLEQGKINFGKIELLSTHFSYFSVDNKNPVEIRLKSWGSNSTWSQVELVGIQKGSKEDLSRIRDFDSMKKSLFLQPGYMAVFSIELRRPSAEGVFFGEAYVTTDHNTLRVPFRFSVSKGSIHSDKISFNKIFPGKISSEKFYLTSTFNHTISLLGIRSDPPAVNWFNPSSGNEPMNISPHRKNYMGKVSLDPGVFCLEDCYAGFPMDSGLGVKWISGMREEGGDRGRNDWEIYKTLQNRFFPVQDEGISNMSLWLETSEGEEFKIPTLFTFHWPRLTNSRSFSFALTGLGNQSYLDIPIFNPSSNPLFIQALLSPQYGLMWSQYVQNIDGVGNLTEGNLVFSLHGIYTSSQSNSSSGSDILCQVQKQLVEESLNVSDPPGVSFLLPPGAKFFLRARFKPLSKDIASTLVLLRNNLTGIETFWIKGRAGEGDITVGNGTPGSSLLFQLTEKLLQGCQKEGASKYSPPHLTVRRSFVARNVGEIPLDIRSLEIFPPQAGFLSSAIFPSRDNVCEGYGFRILNCHPFSLQPNQTHSIDIAFTPDFTMTRVVRSIQLIDSSGLHFNYSLVAMIPSGMLSLCSSIITRPIWEPYLKYFMVALVLIGIVTSSLIAYFDAGSIVSNAVVSTYRVLPADSRERKETTAKFDLKAVYDKVDNRFKRNNASLFGGGTSPHPKHTLQQPLSSFNNQLNNHKSSTSPSESTSNPNDISKGRKKNKNNNNNSGGNHEESNLILKNTNSLLTSIDSLFSKNNTTQDPLKGSMTKEEDNKKGKKPGVGTNKKGGNKNQKNNTTNKKQSTLQQQQKVEEETSSTTTESSNPDDFTNEKERSSSVGGKGGGHGCNGEKGNDKVGANRNKYNENSKAKENIYSEEKRGGGEEFDMVISGGKKKNNALKKRNSSDSSYSAGKGSKPEIASLWDTAKQHEDGMNEINCQESLTMERQHQFPKRAFSDSLMNKQSPVISPLSANAIPFHYPIPGSCGLNGISGNNGALTTSSTTPQQRQMKRGVPTAGVIGQQRPGSHSAQVLNNMTSVALTLASIAPPLTGSSSSSSKNSRISSSSSSSSGGRNSREILPDNGCDIWNRRLTSHSNSPESIANCTSFPVSSAAPCNSSGSAYRSTTIPDLFSGTGGTYPHSHRTSPSQGQAFVKSHFLPSNPTSISSYPMKNGFNSNTGHSSRSSKGASGQTTQMDDSLLFNNGLTNELLNNLWQLNTFESQQVQQQQAQPNMGSNYQPTSTFNPPPSTTVQSGSSTSTSSSFLHRRQRGFSGGSTSGGGSWNNPPTYNFGDNGQTNPGSDNWHMHTGNDSGIFGDWNNLGSGSNNPRPPSTPLDNSIWDSTPAPSKWNSNFTPQNQYPDPTVVGGTRPVSSSSPIELGIRSRPDFVQNQREVEAGLGFNPFTSDIWNQTESTSWNNSNSNFRYSSKNE